MLLANGNNVPDSHTQDTAIVKESNGLSQSYKSTYTYKCGKITFQNDIYEVSVVSLLFIYGTVN